MSCILRFQTQIMMRPLNPVSACSRHSDCASDRFFCQSVKGSPRVESGVNKPGVTAFQFASVVIVVEVGLLGTMARLRH